MERRDPADGISSSTRRGKDEMTKTSIDLQDLRRRIYVKAKAEPSWRFWGLYVHVCKRETLRESYRLAKKNNGAPGIDGVTFDAIGGKSGVRVTPRVKARTRLLSKLKEVSRRRRSQPIGRLIAEINPIVRGWVNYFRIGQSGRCFTYVRNWIEKKVRRAMMRARKRRGFGWNRWSSSWLYETLGLFDEYGLRRSPRMKALPAR